MTVAPKPKPAPKAFEEQRRAIEKGLADIDAGRTVPADDVEAWIDSWDTPDELKKPRSQH